MNQTILVVRALLLVFCVLGGLANWYLFRVSESPWLSVTVGVLIGLLLILIDILLKGFSLRGLTGLTFGLGVGLLASHFITVSPLFDGGDEKVIFISRVAVFVCITYLATVISLRGKDEFNLVIPYVRFQPEKVEAPIVVLDASSLVDGRINKLCEARLMGDILFVPKFVIDDLNAAVATGVEEESNAAKRALKTLGQLKSQDSVELRVHESELGRRQSYDDKMLFVVSSLKGRLFSASETLVARAKQEGVPYIDLFGLAKALSYEVVVGEPIKVKLVKVGKEDSQGVGYLEDGSMVVVNKAADLVGAPVLAEVDSIIPTSGGRMIFAKLLGQPV